MTPPAGLSEAVALFFYLLSVSISLLSELHSVIFFLFLLVAL